MKLIIFPVLCLFFLSCGRMEEEAVDSSISINYPDGPEAFVKGTLCKIVWEPASDAPVKIELYQFGEFSATIAEETEGSGSYGWTIPESLDDGSNFQVRISAANDSNIYGLSQKDFLLLSPGHASTFTDARDGDIYNIVRIGEQVWMAENFKYYPEEGSYCYENNKAYIEGHGRLYTREAALAHCPEGWHLPSDSEWKELEAFLGMPPEELDIFGTRGHSPGELLRPMRGIGFNSIFSGYYNHCVGGYGHIAYESHYWTSSENQEDKPIIRIIDGDGAIHRMGTICHGGCSVRYIKD